MMFPWHLRSIPFRLLYWYRPHKKLTNIRKNPPLGPSLHPTSPQQLGPILNAQEESQQRRSENKTSQFHTLNHKIKNISKLNQLLYLWKKNHFSLSLQQKLAVFTRFVYLSNLQYKQNDDGDNEGDGEINERVLKFLYHIKKAMLVRRTNGRQQGQEESSHTPQVYIGFLNLATKAKDQKVYAYLLDQIIMPIIQRELLMVENQQDNNKKTNICELISISDNVRLLESLFRLINHIPLPVVKISNNPRHSTYLLLLSQIRETIQYLHMPKSPQQIHNKKFMELIAQYVRYVRHLQTVWGKKLIPSALMKCVVRDGVKRVKIEGVKRVKKDNLGEEGPFHEGIDTLNVLKRLLLLEGLYLLAQNHHYQLNDKNLKILHETGDNNLTFHPFYTLQYSINKLLTTPSTLQLQSHHSLNRSLELLSQLNSHISMLFTLPTQLLSKFNLLGSLATVFLNLIKFLSQIFKYKQKSRQKSHPHFNRILENVLSLKVLSRVPGGIHQGKLLAMIFGEWAMGGLTKVEQIVVLNYVLPECDEKKARELVSVFLESEMRDSEEYDYYIRLLLPEPAFNTILDVSPIFKSYKYILRNPSNLSYRQPLRSSLSPSSPHSAHNLQKLLQRNLKQSITNRLFNEKEIERIQKHKDILTSSAKIDMCDLMRDPSLHRLCVKISERMENCVGRFLLVEEVLLADDKEVQEVYQVYREEMSLLNYPALMSDQTRHSCHKIAEKHGRDV